MRLSLFGLPLMFVLFACPSLLADEMPFYSYLTGNPPALMVAYTPSELDPRNPANHEQLKTSSLRADLAALRPTFDGLVLYGYHEASTPRILALAKELKFRAVMLGIWQPKLAVEVDGVAALTNQYHEEMAISICVGNEGIAFGRYEEDDIRFAAARLRHAIPRTVPLTTSEPINSYERKFFTTFGDFLAPNLHPFWEAPELGVDDSAKWVHREAARLVKESGKHVLIKETGVPHAGKDGYDLQRQTDFWNAVLKPGILTRPGDGGHFIYAGVAFEAYDLPWKAEASGYEVEKSWGLFSPTRKAYPALDVWKAQ